MKKNINKNNAKKSSNIGTKIAVWLMLIAMILSFVATCFMHY